MPNPASVAAGVLLGGVLLWEAALRTQMGFSLSFLEEIWSRNLGHVFVSPLRPRELVAALMGMSVIRVLVGVVPAMILAWVLYGFGIWRMGPVVVAFFAALLGMGWAVALGVLTHIAGDALTTAGIPLPVLWLLRRTRLAFSPMRTGTVVEKAVLVPLFLVATLGFIWVNTDVRDAFDPIVDRFVSAG